MGYQAYSSSNASISIGNQNIVNSNCSISIGNRSIVSGTTGFGMSMGINTHATACGAITLGFHVNGSCVNNSNACSFGIGWYSDSPEIFFAKNNQQHINGSGNLIIGSGGTLPSSQQKLHLEGAIYLGDQVGVPTTPTNGGIIFVTGGTLQYIGSSGTITEIGAS